MKKYLSVLVLLFFLSINILAEEKKELQYKAPEIKVIAVYQDLNAVIVCIDGKLAVAIYGCGIFYLKEVKDGKEQIKNCEYEGNEI
jgi:hypothetical protein